MSALSTAWDRMRNWKLRGPWKPGGYNLILLIAQVVAIWSAAQRGMDYANLPDDAPRTAEPGTSPALIGIEADVPLEWLGMSFLLPAGVAFVGLALGWVKMLSFGHLFMGASYLVLGVTFLREAPVENGLTAAVGSGLVVLSALLLVGDFRRVPDILAITGGIACLIVGGWLALRGLGYGYRTGNGFLAWAVLHFVFGFGTQVLARREERLKREEEEDFEQLDGG
jgi:hypothetical protein